ncbi:Ribulosamine/erythrulosamine 3-kinase potentially involved in protein deglycation [hydrothermal vent metagenome]|uniref:Ribulosamine/erythrulosamine 3-kinase potentially involved in protein deglycation n=1 Tax=hydrothermal vent metagenome TaxID=652676 RepID=A0A3B1A9F9_9ZZZZ
MDWNLLAEHISQATAEPFEIQTHNAVGGGCINSAYRVQSKNKAYFVKLNNANKLNMFEAEAAGLAELALAKAIRVPYVVCCGVNGSQSYIVMEHLSLSGRGSMQNFASQLEKLHRYSNSQFGWHQDNTIGSTLQKNQQSDNWLSFWNSQRLGFQLELARQNGASKNLLTKGERIQADLALFFQGYTPEISLLHGDLWSGNVAFTDNGEPVIFDPATYYGDREADIAMTELFGGFSSDFYAHYSECWPLDDGYRMRKHLYNLYHILNHFNMFGGGYGAQAEGMCGQLLSEI